MTGRWRTWGRWVAAGVLALLGVSAAAVKALGWNWPSTTAPKGGRTVLHNAVEISMQTYETLLEQQDLASSSASTPAAGSAWPARRTSQVSSRDSKPNYAGVEVRKRKCPSRRPGGALSRLAALVVRVEDPGKE
jgi:hypothetical protein